MATIGRKSARRAGQNAHNGALDDRKVRRKSLPRSFAHAGELKLERKNGPIGAKGVVKRQKRSFCADSGTMGGRH